MFGTHVFINLFLKTSEGWLEGVRGGGAHQRWWSMGPKVEGDKLEVVADSQK